MSDTIETEPAPREPNRRWAKYTEADFEAQRIALGVADELRYIPDVTTLMLVAFGEQGIKSIEDLAGCATDDLCGWIEVGSGKVIRHDGILNCFKISRSECDAIILHARIKAGWIEKASVTLR